MRARHLLDLVNSESAAVAPTVAISLFGLIAVGGIAFDYARMATLDTELQQGADQAALSAASQLDGHSDAITRATNAAQKLIKNNSLFANDKHDDGSTITVPTITFYSSFTDDNDTTNDVVTTKGEEANFVKVTTTPRTAKFALTPVVGALFASGLSGTAVAGMQSAICNVPPLMMCNPEEAAGNGDVYADMGWTSNVGAGLRLSADASAGIGPGNFGFLDTDITNGGGANELKVALSWDTLPTDCIPAAKVITKPGLMGSAVLPYINERFDIPQNGQECPKLNGKDGTCSAGINVRKDFVATGSDKKDICKSWQENPYPATKTEYDPVTYPNNPARYEARLDGANLDSTITPKIMGLPRDKCHAIIGVNGAGNCKKPVTNESPYRLGDGNWDIDAYWRSNHGGVNYDNSLGTKPTRYDVYKAETNTPATKSGYGSTTAYSTRQCMAQSTASPDKRRLSVAVVNCTAQLEKINGKSAVTVAKWIDVFLVEPAAQRTRCNTPTISGNKVSWTCQDYTPSTDVYFELLGETPASTGAAGAPVRRSIPYLVQ